MCCKGVLKLSICGRNDRIQCDLTGSYTTGVSGLTLSTLLRPPDLGVADAGFLAQEQQKNVRFLCEDAEGSHAVLLNVHYVVGQAWILKTYASRSVMNITIILKPGKPTGGKPNLSQFYEWKETL